MSATEPQTTSHKLFDHTITSACAQRDCEVLRFAQDDTPFHFAPHH